MDKNMEHFVNQPLVSKCRIVAKVHEGSQPGYVTLDINSEEEFASAMKKLLKMNYSEINIKK